MILSFSLEDLEKILYRENSIIASNDVPILLDVLCRESGQKTPARIVSKAVNQECSCPSPGVLDLRCNFHAEI